MTVLIYVNTSKQVGDPEDLKVFANATPRKHGSRKMTPKASLSSMRSWSDRIGRRTILANAADRGLDDPVEFVGSIICQREGPHEVSLALANGIHNQKPPFNKSSCPDALRFP